MISEQLPKEEPHKEEDKQEIQPMFSPNHLIDEE